MADHDTSMGKRSPKEPSHDDPRVGHERSPLRLTGDVEALGALKKGPPYKEKNLHKHAEKRHILRDRKQSAPEKEAFAPMAPGGPRHFPVELRAGHPASYHKESDLRAQPVPVPVHDKRTKFVDVLKTRDEADIKRYEKGRGKP